MIEWMDDIHLTFQEEASEERLEFSDRIVV
jgi:hypothetical protein